MTVTHAIEHADQPEIGHAHEADDVETNRFARFLVRLYEGSPRWAAPAVPTLNFKMAQDCRSGRRCGRN